MFLYTSCFFILCRFPSLFTVHWICYVGFSFLHIDCVDFHGIICVYLISSGKFWIVGFLPSRDWIVQFLSSKTDKEYCLIQSRTVLTIDYVGFLPLIQFMGFNCVDFVHYVGFLPSNTVHGINCVRCCTF